ncbi:MAG: hypothetical protein JWP17_2157 [Solirubrobacterales bacterium]|nr:hypothetical protein [Solirubrobacterales bacterium]
MAGGRQLGGFEPTRRARRLPPCGFPGGRAPMAQRCRSSPRPRPCLPDVGGRARRRGTRRRRRAHLPSARSRRVARAPAPSAAATGPPVAPARCGRAGPPPLRHPEAHRAPVAACSPLAAASGSASSRRADDDPRRLSLRPQAVAHQPGRRARAIQHSPSRLPLPSPPRAPPPPGAARRARRSRHARAPRAAPTAARSPRHQPPRRRRPTPQPPRPHGKRPQPRSPTEPRVSHRPTAVADPQARPYSRQPTWRRAAQGRSACRFGRLGASPPIHRRPGNDKSRPLAGTALVI